MFTAPNTPLLRVLAPPLTDGTCEASKVENARYNTVDDKTNLK